MTSWRIEPATFWLVGIVKKQIFIINLGMAEDAFGFPLYPSNIEGSLGPSISHCFLDPVNVYLGFASNGPSVLFFKST
jgi:hypothetical protein